MSNSEFAEPYTIIEPFGGPFKGDVTVPGDKSISHRAVLFAAMAEGTSHLSGVLDSEDVRASIRAVEALGAEVDLKAQPDGSLSGTVTGWGAEGPSQPAAPIDCGNSGTTARLLMGVVAPWDIEVTITGDESLKKRPMRRIVAPLAKMGVDFVPETPETLPITVCGNRVLRAIDYASPMASAQLKTAVLLAGVFADGTTTVNEPAPSRNHTELMLPEFNVPTTAGHPRGHGDRPRRDARLRRRRAGRPLLGRLRGRGRPAEARQLRHHSERVAESGPHRVRAHAGAHGRRHSRVLRRA